MRTENIGFGDLKLIQNPQEFCYGVDAVILADFAYVFCSDFRNAVDLGCGTGIIPFILSHKNKAADFIGIELQQSSVDLARQSCKLNALESRVKFLNADVADIAAGCHMPTGNADIVTCNPPYVVKGGGLSNENTAKFIARHETTAGLEDFVKAAARLLKGKGHFFMVHRPSRLVDIFSYCREYRLEPKDIRFVTPRAGEKANIVLIHCISGGGKELKLMKELCIYKQDGSYTDEIEVIYERKCK